VGGGFVAAAGQVLPDNAVGRQPLETVSAFWRNIDAAVRAGGAGKVNVLVVDKAYVAISQCWKLFCHGVFPER